MCVHSHDVVRVRFLGGARTLKGETMPRKSSSSNRKSSRSRSGGSRRRNRQESNSSDRPIRENRESERSTS